MTHEEFNQKIVDFLMLSEDSIQDGVHQLYVYSADKVAQEAKWLDIIMTHNTQEPSIQAIIQKLKKSEQESNSHEVCINYNDLSMSEIHILDVKYEDEVEESLTYLFKYQDKYYLIGLKNMSYEQCPTEAIEASSLEVLGQAFDKIVSKYTYALKNSFDSLLPFIEKENLENKIHHLRQVKNDEVTKSLKI